MIYTQRSEIDFAAGDCLPVPRPSRVLLTTPAHFEVSYVINPHMAAHVGAVDAPEAMRQWRRLRSVYEELGFDVSVLEGAPGLPDMVFCANQTLPFYLPDSPSSRDDASAGVVLSRMHAVERRGEVPHFEAYFENIGRDVVHLPAARVRDFEGMGDAIWHPGRHLLWGGYGIRTDRRAYDVLTDVFTDGLEVPIVTIELQDEDFYHLDTCFCALDESSVLLYPGAFGDEALDVIAELFERVIVAPEEEARRRLSCNAHAPDGRHVLIQKGCDVTVKRLRKAGYEPIEVETGEFLKAGGSVFCMKQMFW